MTPTFCWVFLLALVGRAASVPRPLVVDACALLCNPGAETESERERDPVLFPRYPKVNCKLQSDSDDHQAWVIASHCLKLCNYEISISSEVNCFALRSSLQADLGCYCDALTPLSPNTMRLHESWRLNFLVKELAADILNVILISPLDTIILCDIHDELFKDVKLSEGQLVQKCKNIRQNISESLDQDSSRKTRSVERHLPNIPLPEEGTSQGDEPNPHESEDLDNSKVTEPETGTKTEPDDDDNDGIEIEDDQTNEDLKKVLNNQSLMQKLIDLIQNGEIENKPNQKPSLTEDTIQEWKELCKKMCKAKNGNEFCPCKQLESSVESEKN